MIWAFYSGRAAFTAFIYGRSIALVAPSIKQRQDGRHKYGYGGDHSLDIYLSVEMYRGKL